MSLNPRLEVVPAWISAGVRQIVRMDALAEGFGKVYPKVAREIAAAGAAICGPAYGRYFGMPTDVVDVEIGFAIDRVIDLPGLIVSEQPERQAAVGTFVGPYTELHTAYDAFMGWLSHQDLTLADDMFEFYDSPPDTPPEQSVTRIVFPLAEGTKI